MLELSNSIRLPWAHFLFDPAQYEDFPSTEPQNVSFSSSRWPAILPATHRHQERHPDLIQKCSPIFVRLAHYTPKCPYDRLQTEDAYLKGYLGYYGCTDAITRLLSSRRTALPDIIVDSPRYRTQFYIPPENSRRDDKCWLRSTILYPKISSTGASLSCALGSNRCSMPLREKRHHRASGQKLRGRVRRTPRCLLCCEQ